MIEESYVSFDTAKMLKEAGFEANLKTMYVEEEKDEWAFWDSGAKRSDYNYFDDTIACPTQALAARWLREKHHINVYACFDYEKFDERKWFFTREHTMVNDDSAIYCSITNYKSYEEALEAGLKHCLELIKK